MINTNKPLVDEGKPTYDIFGYGLGEGLYCCTFFELKCLKQEIEKIIEKGDDYEREN